MLISLITNLNLNDFFELSVPNSETNDQTIRDKLLDIVDRKPIENATSFYALLNLASNLRGIDLSLSNHILKKLDFVNFGHGSVFTQACFNAFVKNNISIPNNFGVSCKSLGSYGRFGNQIIQYITLCSVAKKLKLQKYFPLWIGNYLFNIQPSTEMPDFEVIDNDLLDEVLDNKISAANFDIGVHLPDLRKFKEYRDMFKNIFKFQNNINIKNELLEMDFQAENSLVIHLRVTDFVQFGIDSNFELIHTWLIQNQKILGFQQIWIVTDNAECIEYFSKDFQIKSLQNVTKKIKDLDFLYDWELLRLSKFVLLNAASTFSSTASFLGREDQICYSQVNRIIKEFTWD